MGLDDNSYVESISVRGVLLGPGIAKKSSEYWNLYQRFTYQLNEAERIPDYWVVCPQEYTSWERFLLRHGIQPTLSIRQKILCFSTQTSKFHVQLLWMLQRERERVLDEMISQLFLSTKSRGA